MILIPRQVVQRVKNDDQLAAVLADGVAYNLQRRSPKLVTEAWELFGVEMAGDAAAAAVPGLSGLLALNPVLNFGTDIGTDYFRHKIYIEMEEQRGRVALSLMADAGYDPWQAPEAWRLLEPKTLPGNLDTLKYPSRAGYQLGILHLQYNPPASSPDQTQKAPSP